MACSVNACVKYWMFPTIFSAAVGEHPTLGLAEMLEKFASDVQKHIGRNDQNADRPDHLHRLAIRTCWRPLVNRQPLVFRLERR